jgi:hypothetical protein
MDRRQIERITSSLAVFLLTFMTVGAILSIANAIFSWDIFPPGVEKFIWFILASCMAIIVSSVLVNVMINISIIALNSDNLGNKKDDKS